MKGKNDYTPLVFAADMGRVDCCKKLVVFGADVQVRIRGLSVLHLNAANGHLDCLKYFIDQGKKHAKFIQNTHIFKGLDAKLLDDKNQSPIFYAARNGHNDVVSLLISRPGVSCTLHTLQPYSPFQAQVDADGKTPLHYAAEAGLLDTCKLLIKEISANVKDNAGHTPLYMAASKGSLRVVSFLLEHKASQLDESLKASVQFPPVALALIRAGADTKFLLGIPSFPAPSLS